MSEVKPAPVSPPRPRRRWERWRTALDKAEAHLASGDLEGALVPAERAAHLAEQLGQANALWTTARIVLNLSRWGLHSRLIAQAERIRWPAGPPEWDGGTLDGTLVITERNNAHVGTAIRLARLIPLAAARAKRCIVLAQPRLISLFRRSFPGVEIRELGCDDAASLAEAAAVSGYHTLVRHLGYDDNVIHAGFRPLVADPEVVETFRTRYGAGPRVGISWHSTNTEKNLATIAEWVPFLRAVPTTFVSLQYGDVRADADALRAMSGANVIYDETVDSLTDLDTYAAQVAAMDTVVTISNTGAHMAGAVAAPTFVLVEEIRKTRLEWPLRGERVAWYPSVTLVRKGGRPWPEVFEDVRQRL